MSQNIVNRIANSISGRDRKPQTDAAEKASEATAPAESASAPSTIEFFKHDPNRQKAYAEGRKRMNTMDNKRKF